MGAGLFCLLEAIYLRSWKRFAIAIAVLAACVLIFLPIRLLEAQSNNFYFTFRDAESMDEITVTRAYYLSVMPDSRFYGQNIALLEEIAFGMLLIAMIVALFRMRYSRVARFLVASVTLLLLTIIPYTGWLVGLIVTPFHLWRVVWLMPFGIALSYLVLHLSRGFARTVRWQWVSRAMLPGVTVLCLILGLYYGRSNREIAILVSRLESGEPFRNTAWSEHLLRVADTLDSLVDGQAVVLAYPRRNAFAIPSLNATLKTVVFREPWVLALQSGISEAEALQRDADYDLFSNRSTASPTRLEILARYGVRLIVLEGRPPIMRGLTREFPDLFELIEFEGTSIYQFDLDAYCAGETSCPD
jgi:hypothetical protein